MNAKEYFINQAKEGKFVEREIEGQKVAIRQISYCEIQKLTSGVLGEKATLGSILGGICSLDKHEPIFTPKEVETLNIPNTTVQLFMKAFFEANSILGGVEEVVKN